MASLPRATPKSQPPRLKADARRAEGEGRRPRAIALLEEVLRQTPEDWGTVQRLADLRAREGSKRRAVELYRRLAEHYEEDDHLPRAIAVWRVVLRHDPGFSGAHFRLGELYGRQGFRAESRRHYEAAVAGFEEQRRPYEASLARRALEATREDAPAPVDPAHQSAGEENLRRLSPDDEELVAERLLEAKMYRRYNLPKQARAALETVLGMVPGHAEARAELEALQGDEGARSRAGQPPVPVAAPDVPVAHGAGPRSVEPTGDQDLESLGFTLVVEGSPAAVEAENPGEVVLPGLFDDLVAEAERPRPPDTGSATAGDLPLAPVPPILRHHVDAQLAPEDYRARYDLGIAFREMGLVDEAIAELQLASRDPGRLLDCVSPVADCFLEKGLPALAVTWLERGLAAGPPSDDARHALQYELGHALERAGEAKRALETLTELYGEAAGHRDVAARVRRLHERSVRAAPAATAKRGE